MQQLFCGVFGLIVNNVVWNAQYKNALLIFHSALDTYRYWNLANQQAATSTSCPRQIDKQRWSKPLSPVLKCNVDADIFSNPPRMGFWCLVRDSSGHVVDAIYGCLLGSFSSMAEALSVREALS